MLWSLHGDAAPLDIDRQEDPWPLLASPDAHYILYSTERAVMVLDTITPAGRLSSGRSTTAAA